MEYILNNEQLTVTFTTKGGTICSIEDFMFEECEKVNSFRFF